MSNQPAGMLNDYGVVLTIGIVNYADRCAIVLPIGTDDTAIEDSRRCFDVIASFKANVMDSLTPMLASTSHISFIQAEGMTNGMTPYREDFTALTYPGGAATAGVSSQVTGLIAFYEDPDDNPSVERTRVGKNFIPAVPAGEVTGDILESEQVGLMVVFGQLIQQGFESIDGPGYKYYRVLVVPGDRDPGQTLIRTINATARGYVCTQRRRLTPRA